MRGKKLKPSNEEVQPHEHSLSSVRNCWKYSHGLG